MNLQLKHIFSWRGVKAKNAVVDQRAGAGDLRNIPARLPGRSSAALRRVRPASPQCRANDRESTENRPAYTGCAALEYCP